MEFVSPGFPGGRAARIATVTSTAKPRRANGVQGRRRGARCGDPEPTAQINVAEPRSRGRTNALPPVWECSATGGCSPAGEKFSNSSLNIGAVLSQEVQQIAGIFHLHSLPEAQ